MSFQVFLLRKSHFEIILESLWFKENVIALERAVYRMLCNKKEVYIYR